MTEPIPPELEPFVAEKVVLLQTRKRDGSWVDTPSTSRCGAIAPISVRPGGHRRTSG